MNGCSAVGGGPRGAVVGWSAQSARRNSDWLQSVDYGAMRGRSWAVTLTVPGLPSPSEWRGTVRRFLDWASRRTTALHCVTEFQLRGAPHLHVAVWGGDGRELVGWWLAHWPGSSRRAQHWRRIRTPAMWAQYCAKHGARGVRNVQRNRAVMVGRWRTESAGRLWHVRGDWAVCAGAWFVFEGGEADYWRLREAMLGLTGAENHAFFWGCGSWGHFALLGGFQFRTRDGPDRAIEGASIWRQWQSRQ